MNWVVFSYSLPSHASSSPRVALWRRLNRLGAVSPTSGLYVLPARDECVEAFQWLAQEIRQAQGDALVMRVEQFEALSSQQLIDLFNTARRAEYQALEKQAAALEKTVGKRKASAERAPLKDRLEKLRKQYADIARVDYFDCPAAAQVAARLDSLEQALAPNGAAAQTVMRAALTEYSARRWVTRPRPHVDRLACAWLIRRFINPQAVIRYSTQPESGEIAFDMTKGDFGHAGNLCTFEVMLRAFGLNEPALSMMAEMVHEIDLRDGQYGQPHTDGIDAVLNGWLLLNLSDAELEARGIALFEGLYATLSSRPSARSRGRKQPRRKKPKGDKR